MSTVVFNDEGKCVSQSHNLRGMFEWARRAGGVRVIECHTFPHTDASYTVGNRVIPATRPEGYVIVRYANGYRAETWFSCAAHLIDWATDRVKPNRASWFAGASLSFVRHAAWRDMSAR